MEAAIAKILSNDVDIDDAGGFRSHVRWSLLAGLQLAVAERGGALFLQRSWISQREAPEPAARQGLRATPAVEKSHRTTATPAAVGRRRRMRKMVRWLGVVSTDGSLCYPA